MERRCDKHSEGGRLSLDVFDFEDLFWGWDDFLF